MKGTARLIRDPPTVSLTMRAVRPRSGRAMASAMAAIRNAAVVWTEIEENGTT